MEYTWIFCDGSQAEARVVATAGPIPLMKQWFATNEDVHLNVAKMIGKVVEEHRIEMPYIPGTRERLWGRKPWQQLTKSDPIDNAYERHISKTTVHGNNYDMGRLKFATVTRLPIKYAETIQNVYHNIFPEIRGNYHVWIQQQLKNGKTIVNGWGWPRTFYGNYDNDMERAGYAWYAQSTIGMWNIRLLTELCEVFHGDKHIRLYTPEAIRECGYDTQAQLHDGIGIVAPNQPGVINEMIRVIKEKGERPLVVRGEELVIPLDFKTGPSMGELHDIKD